MALHIHGHESSRCFLNVNFPPLPDPFGGSGELPRRLANVNFNYSGGSIFEGPLHIAIRNNRGGKVCCPAHRGPHFAPIHHSQRERLAHVPCLWRSRALGYVRLDMMTFSTSGCSGQKCMGRKRTMAV
ncbi:hypothetical protein CEXT_762251 [Caerostris extrusa]|uniref:Uncharacterized protein n=1 Tax=Caerostris extrusa TaxID=172846 RepID=A0AAV4NGB2_CAEEX|nr:hypothetical protein CEXT_762251 [Caerostris extrusa]